MIETLLTYQSQPDETGDPAYRRCGKTKMTTLGPAGTCSEKSAHEYARRKRIDPEVALMDSFESAVDEVAAGRADQALVAAAYARLNELVFANYGLVTITDSFVDSTPGFLIGAPTDAELPSQGLVRISSHHAPVPLLKRFQQSMPKLIFEVVDAASNAAAAIMAMEGVTQFALTNSNCATVYGLKSLVEFGQVQMAFVIFSPTERRN